MNFEKQLLGDPEKTTRILKVQKLLNLVLKRLGMKAEVAALLNNGSEMVTLYQKMNLYHILNNLIDNRVQGDIVEMGCYDGQTASLFQFINQSKNAGKQLYLFDNFKHDFGKKSNILTELIENFKIRNLKTPIIVEGNFKDTVPEYLPEKISFLHIDCGFGGDTTEHKNNILHILNHSYHRMTPGSIAVFMDYHIEGITLEGINSNPGVKMACDEFLSDKKEKVYTLFGGMYSHGYLRKAGDTN